DRPARLHERLRALDERRRLGARDREAGRRRLLAFLVDDGLGDHDDALALLVPAEAERGHRPRRVHGLDEVEALGRRLRRRRQLVEYLREVGRQRAHLLLLALERDEPALLASLDVEDALAHRADGAGGEVIGRIEVEGRAPGRPPRSPCAPASRRTTRRPENGTRSRAAAPRPTRAASPPAAATVRSTRRDRSRAGRAPRARRGRAPSPAAPPSREPARAATSRSPRASAPPPAARPAPPPGAGPPPRGAGRGGGRAAGARWSASRRGARAGRAWRRNGPAACHRECQWRAVNASEAAQPPRISRTFARIGPRPMPKRSSNCRGGPLRGISRTASRCTATPAVPTASITASPRPPSG